MPIGLEHYAEFVISLTLLAVAVIFLASFYRRPIAYCGMFEKSRNGVFLFISSFGLYLAVEVLEIYSNAAIEVAENAIQFAMFAVWIAALLYFMRKCRGV